MRATVQTEFQVRDKKIVATHVFPRFSDEIEQTLIRQLTFCKKLGKPFLINLRIEENEY